MIDVIDVFDAFEAKRKVASHDHITFVILMTGCAIFIIFYRGPRLTNREAVWVLCGMLFGTTFWIAAVILKLPHIYRPYEPNPLVAVTVIGGMLGWVAAKALRFNGD